MISTREYNSSDVESWMLQTEWKLSVALFICNWNFETKQYVEWLWDEIQMYGYMCDESKNYIEMLSETWSSLVLEIIWFHIWKQSTI